MSETQRRVGRDWTPFLISLSGLVLLGGALLSASVWALVNGEGGWAALGAGVFVVNAVVMVSILRDEWPL